MTQHFCCHYGTQPNGSFQSAMMHAFTTKAYDKIKKKDSVKIYQKSCFKISIVSSFCSFSRDCAPPLSHCHYFRVQLQD